MFCVIARQNISGSMISVSLSNAFMVKPMIEFLTKNGYEILSQENDF